MVNALERWAKKHKINEFYEFLNYAIQVPDWRASSDRRLLLNETRKMITSLQRDIKYAAGKQLSPRRSSF